MQYLYTTTSRLSSKRVCLFIILFIITQSMLFGQTDSTGLFTDPRDGQIYQTVKIGDQWWLAQNLNFEIESTSWCLADDPTGAQFGRFYNWEAAKQAIPDGWHLPTKAEYEQMLSTIGSGELPNWDELYPKLIEGGDSGFNAQLTGSHQEKYGHRGNMAHFWSSELWWFTSLFKFTENPWRLTIHKDKSYVDIAHFAESDYGFNVRCVMDDE